MKNYKSTILLFLAAFIFYSCQDEENEPVGSYISVGMNIFLKSENGVDLLNPDNPEHYDHNQIELYYLINGEAQYVYNENLHVKKGFFIAEHPTLGYFLAVGLNKEPKDDFTITYLKWNESDTDTLRCQIKRENNDNYVVLDKLWYNEKLVWEYNTESYGKWSTITILK